MDNNYLKQIINEYPEVWKDGAKLKALLMDFYPQDRALRNNLYFCVEEKIPEELSKKSKLTMDEIYSYKKRLINSYGCSDTIAEQAVTMWMDALKVVLIKGEDVSNKESANRFVNINTAKRALLFINLNEEKECFWGGKNGYFELIFDIFKYEKYVLSNIAFTQIYIDYLINSIEEVMLNLTEKEQNIINNIYGLKGLEKKNITRISKELNDTRYNVQKTYNKALRKLRHPSRARKICVKSFGYKDEEFIDAINYNSMIEKIILEEVDHYNNTGKNEGYFTKSIIEKNDTDVIKDIIAGKKGVSITRAKLIIDDIFYLLKQGVLEFSNSFKCLSFEDLMRSERNIAWYLLNYTDPILIINISKNLKNELLKKHINNYYYLVLNKNVFTDSFSEEINSIIKIVDENNTAINKWFELNNITDDDRKKCRITDFGRVEKYKYIKNYLEELQLTELKLEEFYSMGIETIYDLVNMSTEDFFNVLNRGTTHPDSSRGRIRFELRRIERMLNGLVEIGVDKYELLSKYEELEKRKHLLFVNNVNDAEGSNGILSKYPDIIFDDEELPFK